MEPPQLTERLLNDAGGWQVMKQARALHEMGRVVAASWAPPLLQGRVREGETEYRSGLRIHSKTNVENLCTCAESRRRGAICAHSVAVGLEVLKPRPASTPVVAQDLPAGPAQPPASAVPPVEADPRFSMEAGEPFELFVILPPNFPSAWEKGSVTTVFEASLGGKRMPLTALPKTRLFRCGEGDLRLLATLQALGNGVVPGMAVLSRPQFLSLLGELGGHPHVSLGKGARVAVRLDALLPPLTISHEDTGAVRLRATLPESAVPLLDTRQAWLFSGSEFRPVAPGAAPAYQELLLREIVLSPEQAASFLRKELAALRTAFAFDEQKVPLDLVRMEGTAEKPAFALHLEGSLNHLAGRLDIRYGEHSSFTVTSGAVRTSYARDPAAEHATLERLRKAGFAGPDAQGQLVLKGQARILAFFARDLPWWERNAEVHLGARFQHVTRDVERIQPRLEIRGSGENWFELGVELGTAGGERFSGAEIQRLLHSGQSHVKRKDGKLAVFDPLLLDEFQQVLQDCDPAQPQPGLYRIDRRHAAYLESVVTEQGASLEAPSDWRSWATATRHLDRLTAIPLGPLETTLRPYQKQGVYWMHFLAQNGLGGILADEMGLGKTVQALAVLRGLPGKALVICPSSLVYNWQREAERFTPERRVLAIEGPDRQRLFGKPLAEADLVITSYPLLRRDAGLYRGTEFAAAILDEAQHIKNPESQNAQSAFSIRARHRFVLTGTPVENSVRDIWALMNFVMPGYLGSRTDFRERFEQAVMAQPGGPEHQRLAKRLAPFVLRRLKRSVITDLPEKIEQVAYCELTKAQAAVYGELVSATRRQAADWAGAKDQNKARMLMLTALLRLRQACCDLRLLNLEEAAKAEDSAKIELLEELLGEAIDGDHRVLVFSQFATMLGLLRERLVAADIDFCYLDGSTKDRAAQVDRFQQGNVPVFLISLKAGGVGLNLTAADTVIHFDPWWNPAVEAQATDRAHRIGQKKVVTAYKLIARGTVEEKILALQARKRQVIDATIESEQPMMQGLTLDDLQELLG